MNLPLAPAIAALLGAVAALLTFAVPAELAGELVMASGLPAVIAAAEPPLGWTARTLIAIGVGGLVAAFGWLGLFVLIGTRSLALGAAAESAPQSDTDEYLLSTPVLRRADAHPDAPPRPPLFAMRDLGTPFLEVRAPDPQEGRRIGKADGEPVDSSPAPEPAAESAVEPAAAPSERALPRDCSQPLAAFDPGAIPDVPLLPPVKLPPLRSRPRAPVYEARERFEVFELTPPSRPGAEPRGAAGEARDERITRPETEASVHALLERLERGMIRHGLAAGSEAAAPRPPASRIERRKAERGLEDALITLRNLARRA